MKVTSLTLTDFLLVKDSGINHLEIKFTEDVQIIIGISGSGKSSVLRQLSAIPASRSLFGKKGYKELILEKDGVSYCLETNYSKPSAPHAFYEGDNDENLNSGGTSEIQKELIQEHLGITPFVDDLIMNRFVFPKWTPSKRKEFLLSHNPDDIGFVLNLAKQTSSKIRACKNNISRLQSRKILLEQDLLDPDSFISLEQEKEKITEDLGNLQKLLMDIEIGLSKIGTINNHSLYDTKAILKTVKSIRYSLNRYSHIEREDEKRFRIRDKLVGDLASFDHQIKQTDEDILTQTNELAELETRYRELSPDGDLLELEATINRLERDRDKLTISKPQFEVTQEELDHLYRGWDEIREKLLIFSHCEIPLLSSRKRQRRERLLSSKQYILSSYQMKLSDLKSQYEELSKRHTLSPKDIPDTPCAKERCPLYSHFLGNYKESEEKRNSISTMIRKIERKSVRLETYIGIVSTYFREVAPYTECINWLISQAQSNPILHDVLKKMDILTILKSRPNLISLRVKEAYDHIGQYLRLKSVLSDLETAYTLKNRFIGSQSHDTVKLVVSIENLKKSLYRLQNGILTLSDKRKAVQNHLDDISTYESLKKTLFNIRESHLSYSKILSDKHESDKLLFLRKGIEDIRSSLFVRLSEVERTLRAQSGLKERYEEEVIKELTRLEQEVSDLEKIEKALVAIPRENTIDFVNGIFKQANKLIDVVWTIPLEIELLKPDDPLNYEFTVLGDNGTVREMSECSEGQTEMISFAINMALRIQLGHLNIPLCLDEASRTMDEVHKQNFARLLKSLLDSQIFSQLFFVSHHAAVHEAFSDNETFVVREDNVMLPPDGKYNQHVVIG